MGSELTCIIKSIDKNAEINKNAVQYIKHNNLKKVRFNVSRGFLRNKDLPTDTILGTTYLVKGNNIMYFNSYVDPAYSPRIEINIKTPRWICKSDVVNKEDGDPENLNEIIIYYKAICDPEYLELVILGYIMNKGFDLYIKTPSTELDPL